MQPRIAYRQVAPQGYQRMLSLHTYLQDCGLEQSLIDLVNLRVSQINGCAFCIDMHWKDLRAGGQNEQRLYMLDAWREAPFYTERERAALAWAEAMTLISESGETDSLYESARQQFSETELVNLTLAVVAINGWNRLNIAFRTVPGGYQPKGSTQ